ncbi:hypothetical protein CXB51_016121 [Gossypium anomalum]|uniref:RNase H type-1 domain-containing protein n=1 Tax=Gossypium anomalum TaxID=47600 RepID=A0A8J5YPY2_9ROSI|nr:hypothetical protein CXB51_016121 [Gossypium anomalum]
MGIGIFRQWELWSEIIRISTKVRDCRFEYTPRSSNELAHTIATETLKRRQEIYLKGNAPEYAVTLKEKESVREPD